MRRKFVVSTPTALAVVGLFHFCSFPPSARADSITVGAEGQANASQSGVYRVHRNIFRKGGHGWKERSPDPYGDGYNYGDVGLTLDFSSLIDVEGIIESAIVNWSFSDLTANTQSQIPEYDHQYGNALAPRAHGSNSLCSGQPCSPASMNRWEPNGAFWSNRVTLGDLTYWFPDGRHSSGSLNLLDLWSSDQIAKAGHLTFYGTVQYGMGRPFFNTEGWNADTEFYVWGNASVNAAASLQLQYSPPTLPPPPETPEPGSWLMLCSGLGLMVFSRIRHRRAW